MKRGLVFAVLFTVLPLASCADERAGAQGKAPPAPAAAPSLPTAQTAPAPHVQAGNAELGKNAPTFTLSDTDGKSYDLAKLRGKIVVLEWFNPDCPFVKHAHGKGPLTTLAKDVRGDDLVWLTVNSSAPGKQGHGVERNKQAKSEFGIENPVLLDESGAVGRTYGALKTPHLAIIDRKGVLVYRGGLDNAPMGVVDEERPRPSGASAAQPFNYIKAALENVRKGKKVELADTPSYGCSVKYAS